jgi:hypothetical protein
MENFFETLRVVDVDSWLMFAKSALNSICLSHEVNNDCKGGDASAAKKAGRAFRVRRRGSDPAWEPRPHWPPGAQARRPVLPPPAI